MAISPRSGCAWRGVPAPWWPWGCLDLAKEHGELFLGDLVATQQRFQRVHEKHLNTDKFGENVHVHLRVTADNIKVSPMIKLMQEHERERWVANRPRPLLRASWLWN